MSTDWRLKLISFLHDPPDKVFALKDHQPRAYPRMEQVLGNDEFQALFETDGSSLTGGKFGEKPHGKAVKKADQVASAMDRAAFPRDVNLTAEEFRENPYVSHPLAGRQRKLEKFKEADQNTITSALDKVIADVAKVADTPKQRFLWLWRKLAASLAAHDAANGLASDWQLIPADTRIVDHSLWDHLGVTAALAVALPHAALFVCSIGPVQDFIRTARRTQDLWMGSYMLSYLAWCGIRIIADEFGPDAVIYPSLYGQPLVDQWLAADHKWQVAPPREDLTRATLPNKFVALLPAADAKEVAERVTDAVRNAWRELADGVAWWLWREASVTTDAVWQQLFDSHKQQMPELYWSIHRWPDVSKFTQSKDEADAALDEVQRLLSPPSDWQFKHTYDVFCATAPKMVNIGTLYSCLHDLAQRGFEARKGLRDFAPIEERGEKCTLCGVRAALHNDGLSARDHWREVAKRVRGVKGEFVTVKPGGRERLCGMCTVKRLVQRSFFERKLGLRGGFPSTSSIAAASFKSRVIEKLTDIRLARALRTHLDALQQLGLHWFAEGTGAKMLPHLMARAMRLSGAVRKLAIRFLRYDGNAFYDETFTVERMRDDYDLQTVTQNQVDAARRTLGSLLGACRELGIDAPAKYFAVLMLDGDEMGKWLSGDKAPLFSQALRHEAVQDLRTNHPTWATVLDAKRVLSPALHASMSRALANFALSLVPLVVEQQYCGRVVYAGGDDVLALLPVDQVLPAARELRAVFSGEATIDSNHQVNPCFRDATVSGFLTLDDQPLLTMGPQAKASVGISIAHHLSPLDAALAAAHRAESAAKNQYGRNALCLHFLKRSGEELRVGAQWFYSDTSNDTQDTVGLLADLQRRFAEDRVSMKFAHAVFDTARTLAGVPTAQKAELCRLLKRHRGKALNSQEGEEQAKDLAPKLAQLARSLEVHLPKTGTELAPDQPQPGLVELAKWLLLVRFLAQGASD